MTTEPTSEAPHEARPDAECDNCGGPVRARRPSRSGKHFCSKPDCLAAKQRFHYRRRADGEIHREEMNRQILEQARDGRIIALVRALAHGPRVTCDDCGRTDALPGYAHLDSEGEGCGGTRTDDVKWPSGIGSELATVIWPRGS